MKEFIDLIKKLLENKRTRALAILLIYAVFFTFVFLLIGNTTTTPKLPEDPDNKLLDKQISKIEFIGAHNFTVENDSIIYNESIYSVKEMPIELSDYDLSIYTMNNIDKLIESAVLESTNYVEKTNTYLITVKEFESIIYNNDLELNSNIRISINEETLEFVNIDFKEYYGYEVKISLRS